MSRDTKFRAWNKNTRKMLNDLFFVAIGNIIEALGQAST